MSQANYDNLDGVPQQTEGVSEILASDWNTYVRGNFDALKFGHLVVANDSARNALSVDEGTMVFVSDSDSFWVFDGSQWQRVVNTDSIKDSAVTAAKLASSAVETAKINNNAVTDAKLRDSAGLSVIGNATNSSADPADITAGTDHYVLRRSGTSLGFGLVDTDNIANDAVTTPKLNIAVSSDPSPGGYAEGDVIFNTTDNALKVHNGSSWVEIASLDAYPSCHVYVNTAYTHTVSGDYQTISWTNELYDTDDMWSSGDPTKIFLPRSGIYAVSGTVAFYGNATGTRAALLGNNGSTYLYGPEIQAASYNPGPGVEPTLLNFSWLVKADNAGDYISLYIRQNTGGSLAYYFGYDKFFIAASFINSI